MEPIESSETSAYINTLTPGTYPKEKKLQGITCIPFSLNTCPILLPMNFLLLPNNCVMSRDERTPRGFCAVFVHWILFSRCWAISYKKSGWLHFKILSVMQQDHSSRGFKLVLLPVVKWADWPLAEDMNNGSFIKAACKIEADNPNLSDRECNNKVPLTGYFYTEW
jgi:hypothetical protein